jgi:hypothetical protein
MAKSSAIDKINSLDKKKIYEMIDSVPNIFIAKQFKEYLIEKKQEIEKSDIKAQIGRLWNEIIKGAYGKQKEKKAK